MSKLSVDKSKTSVLDDQQPKQDEQFSLPADEDQDQDREQELNAIRSSQQKSNAGVSRPNQDDEFAADNLIDSAQEGQYDLPLDEGLAG